MRNRFRTTFATAAAAALVLGSAGLASADQVNNDIESSAGGVVSVEADESASVSFYVKATGGDSTDTAGRDGNNCNPLVSPVTISFVTDADVSPSSLVFDACDAEQAVQFSSDAAGTYPVTVTTNGGDDYKTANADFTLVVTDTSVPANTPPQVSVTGFTDGDVVEIGSEPTPGCSVVDAEDGDQTVTPTVTGPVGPLAAYGLGAFTVTCSYTDSAGETGTATAGYTVRDTGAPVIADLGQTSAPDGANGWYISEVTNDFRAIDAGAGFETDSPKLLTKDITVSSGAAEGAAVTVSSGPVTDVAGNTAASIYSAAFKIDLSDPTDVTFVGDIADGDSHAWGDTPAAPTCTATDAVSGLAACAVTGYSTDVGTHTLTATATDNAGRTATATLSYTVDPWRHDGFYRPVDMGKVNTVKAGSTVPLKFNVFKADAPITDVAVLDATFTVKRIGCDTGTATDAVEEFATTGGTTLRYDAEGQQWVQNWATPRAGKGNCYLVTVTTPDRTETSARFQLK